MYAGSTGSKSVVFMLLEVCSPISVCRGPTFVYGGGLCIAINVGERLKEEMIIPEAVPGRVFN